MCIHYGTYLAYKCKSIALSQYFIWILPALQSWVHKLQFWLLTEVEYVVDVLAFQCNDLKTAYIHTHVGGISVYVLTLLIFHHNRRCHFKHSTFMAVGYQKSVIQMPLEISQYDLQMPELISFAKEIVVRKFDEIKKLTHSPVQFEAICVNCSRYWMQSLIISSKSFIAVEFMWVLKSLS